MSAFTRAVFDRYLTEAEERKLFATVKDSADRYAQRDYAWMRLTRYTGVRLGALSKLTVRDATDALRAGRLVLPGSIQKGGIAHDIYLTKKARQALQDLLRIRREMGHAAIPDDPLVMSRHRLGLCPRAFQLRMRMWCRRAGLPHEATPHWLRHTLAKRVMKQSTAQDPRGVVQGILGHSSINSTSYYTMPDREEIEAILDEVA